MARKLEPPPLHAWSITCPYCQKKFERFISSEEAVILCPICGKDYVLKTATVRAKRKKKLSWQSERNYLRIITGKGEREIFFDNARFIGDEFGLRSGDKIYIIYSRKQPSQALQVFNETTRQCAFIQIEVKPNWYSSTKLELAAKYY